MIQLNDPIQPHQNLIADVVAVEIILPETTDPLAQVDLLITECAGVMHIVSDPNRTIGVKVPEVLSTSAAFPAGTYRLVPGLKLYAVASAPTAFTVVPVLNPGTVGG